MRAPRFVLLGLLAALLLPAAAIAQSAPKPVAVPLKLRLSGVEYVQRWSKNGQSEFTPAAQTDTKTWRDKITLLVNEQVRTSDQLATLANTMVGSYGKSGEILRTDSKPATEAVGAEHFIAATVHAPGGTEAVFTRVFLHEGAGVVVVYSHRAYGAHSEETIRSFLDHNGSGIERALMSWSGMPPLARLRAPPQAPAPGRPEL